jgi:hypothetical protein
MVYMLKEPGPKRRLSAREYAQILAIRSSAALSTTSGMLVAADGVEKNDPIKIGLGVVLTINGLAMIKLERLMIAETEKKKAR